MDMMAYISLDPELHSSSYNAFSPQVHVVEHIMRLYPDAPKYLIGFSCGANLAINYLAHVGNSSPFIASASVSNGYNILKGEKESLNIT